MVHLIPMTESEFDAYLEKTVPEYAAEKVRAGHWPESEALELSRKSYQTFLPQGVKTEHHYLFRIQLVETGEKIGILWMKHEAPGPHGFLFDIVIDEAQRGKGYGKQALHALEEAAKELGIKTIGLHVFAHNPNAVELYKKAGYEITSMNMVKRLVD